MLGKEGWCDRGYLQLFLEETTSTVTQAYGLAAFVPGMTVIGLIGWDDLLIRDRSGSVWTLPTVPMRIEHLEHSLVDFDSEVIPDTARKGKVKWYVTPLLFGGSPIDESNIIWIDLEKHCELVRWWNDKYEELRLKT